MLHFNLRWNGGRLLPSPTIFLLIFCFTLFASSNVLAQKKRRKKKGQVEAVQAAPTIPIPVISNKALTDEQLKELFDGGEWEIVIRFGGVVTEKVDWIEYSATEKTVRGVVGIYNLIIDARYDPKIGSFSKESKAYPYLVGQDKTYEVVGPYKYGVNEQGKQFFELIIEKSHANTLAGDGTRTETNSFPIITFRRVGDKN